MVLIVRENQTGKVYEVAQFLAIEGGKKLILAEKWPGQHYIGKDCEWLEISQKDAERIKWIMENPGLTITQIRKQLKLSYSFIFRLIKCYNLEITRERKERGKARFKQHFAKKKGCF